MNVVGLVSMRSATRTLDAAMGGYAVRARSKTGVP
jgi:hypothetical protein